ncbi:MAG: GNAT family N-acetyltransferase [Candidatus Thorarchaeota archaeon]
MTIKNKCIQHNLNCVNEITIRGARREDIPSIVETSWASTTEEEMVGFTAPEWGTFRDAEKLRNEWIKENKLRDDYEVIVAERTGQIIGYVVFKREKEFLYIDLIHVRKSQRGKGFGRALVEYIERLAIEGGQTRIETETTENAQGMPWWSYGFWLGMGFSDTGERVTTKWNFKLIPFIKRLS